MMSMCGMDGAQRAFHAEHLLLKAQWTVTPEDENAWPSLSLALAMRGHEAHEESTHLTKTK
jgi:hypothetical protein